MITRPPGPTTFQGTVELAIMASEPGRTLWGNLELA